MICNNCFKEGHFYKDCDEPLMSFGLCCYKKVENNYKFLMVSRRHTYTYIEFLRGLYDILDIEYIQNMFNKMNLNEKKNILENNFKYLWEKIWLTNINNRKNKTEFYKGIIKFNILKNGFYNNNKFYNLNYYVENSKTEYKDPEWYFPKGKKEKEENEINASLREFIEETNISKEKINIREDIKLEEIHIGSNNKKYKTILYLCEYKENDYLDIVNNFNNNIKNNFQKIEIGNIKWISLKELKTYFRNYEKSKIELINQINNIF